MLREARKPNTKVTASKPRISIRTRIMILALMLIVPLMVDRVRLLEPACRGDGRGLDSVDAGRAPDD